MTRYLKRDDILRADDLRYVDVEVPEWGGVVRVRTLTGTERSQYQASVFEFGADGKSVRYVLEYADLKLAALSLVDPETGERMFSLEEIEVLGRKSAQALDRVVEAARRLSALTARDVEELAGGLGGTPNGASSSPSPAS